MAQYDFLRRMGQGEIGGALIKDLKIQGSRANQRPAMGSAEAERANVDQLLRQQQPGGAPPLPGPRSLPGNLPSMAERRADPNFSLPRNAPVSPGEVETWVSPAGRSSVTRDAHGYRGKDGKFRSSPPRGYRRISEADPTTMAEFLTG